MPHILRWCALGVLFTSVASAQTVDHTGSFALFLVETELQRALVADKTTAYGLIDGDALIVEGRIDPAALDTAALRSAFKKVGEKAKDGYLLFHTRVALSKASDFEEYKRQSAKQRKAMEFLNHAVRSIAIEAGYPPKRILPGYTYHGHGESWSDMMEKAKAQLDQIQKGPESPAMGKTVRAYPVRSLMSSLLTDQADCVVFLTDKVNDPEGDVISATMQKELTDLIADLKLDRRVHLRFWLTSKGEGRKAVQRFELGPARAVAIELGFERATVLLSAYK